MSETTAEKSALTANDHYDSIVKIIAIQEADIAKEKALLEVKEHNLTALKTQFEEMTRLSLPPRVTTHFKVGGYGFRFDRQFFDRNHTYKKSKPEAYHFENFQDDLANALLGCDWVYEVEVHIIGDSQGIETKVSPQHHTMGISRQKFDDLALAEHARIIRAVLTRHEYLQATFGEDLDKFIFEQM